MTDQSPLNDADRHARIFDLARTYDLARDLAPAFDLARDLTLTFDRACARDRALNIAPASNHRPLATALLHDLTPTLDRARELTVLPVLAFSLAVDRARDLTLALDRARDLTLNLNRFLTHGRGSTYALALARDLHLTLNLLRQALRQINTSIDQWEQLDAFAKAKPAPVARLAERLVDVVMRLLPAQHRSRYAEEFKGELYGLAQAKATATVQVVYALQQLGRVWKTRESLLRPALPRFHRLHRTACWVLATETRTWTPLTGLLLWGGAETALDTGPGTAILLVAGSGAVLQAGVTWGRNRLGVEVRQRKSTE